MKSKFQRLDLQRVIQATGAVRHNNGTETYWMGRCPVHDDKNPSCKITGEPHDAKVHCFAGCPWQAVRDTLLARGCAAYSPDGLDETYISPARRDADKKGAPADDWEIVSPIPDNAPPPLKKYKDYPPPSKAWKYHNEEGDSVFYEVRFDLPDGSKAVIPQTLWRNKKTGTLEWRWKAYPAPRPLYNLHLLKKYPDAKVIGKEGEKAADAAAVLFPLPHYVCVTSSGGCNAEDKTDWTPLNGRDFIGWPDADDAGRDYANDVARLAHKAGAASVKILPVLDGKPEGWDAADALAEGWDAEQAAAYLSIAEPWTPPADTTPTGTAEADDEDDFTPTPDPWPKMPDAAFYGLAGKFVELVKTQVEADPAALLIQFLAAFGNLVGRGPHFIAGADYHALNLFTCLVGKSARGRKTQALNAVLTALKPIDPDWFEHRVSSGLASGEGLKNKLRDDSGEIDKRLLLREAEFGSVLSVCARKDNTLSSTLRNFWDFGTFESLTKGDPFKVTGAHVTILANITQKELDKKLNEVDIANGFGNRFLWILAKISNRLPRGGRVDEILLSPIIKPLCDALEFARSIGEAEIGMTEAAWQLWEMDGGIYDHLRRNIPGVLGEITSRAEAQVRRLACIYALLDQSQIVDVPHLDAAVAVWDYVEASERIIFGDSTGNPIADTIMTHLRQSPDGLTRKEIIEGIFQRNKPSKEIAQALYLLEEAKMARKERIQTNGRPAERWLATWT